MARRRSYLTVVIFTFPGRVPIFLGIKAKRRCLKLVAALMRAAVQEPRHQLLVHPLSMRTTRWIHKGRTSVPEFPVPAKLAVSTVWQRQLGSAMALVMFLGRFNMRGQNPGRRRARRRRPACMAILGTRFVPRIAPLGSALLGIKAGGRCLSAVAALHLIVRAPFLGYRKERA